MTGAERLTASATSATGRGGPGGAPRALPLSRDTISWQVNGDVAPFLGASAALLLQVAHPLVAAGVAQHSDYRSDPFSRLYRTLDTVLKVVFGSPDDVRRMRRRLATRHAPITGVARDGRPYDARDPELGLWVWATLVHTGLAAYERVHGPLSAGDRERFYQEAKLFAEASGVPLGRCPAAWDDFLAYYRHVVDHDLARTPECIDVARSTFVAPTPPVVGPLGGRLNAWLAAALLPPRVRELYGLNWTPRRERRFDRWMRIAGAVLRRTPRRLRELPVVLIVDHDLLDALERRRQRRRNGRGGVA